MWSVRNKKRIIRGGLVQGVITRFIPDSDAAVSVRFVVDYDGITGSRASCTYIWKGDFFAVLVCDSFCLVAVSVLVHHT